MERYKYEGFFFSPQLCSTSAIKENKCIEVGRFKSPSFREVEKNFLCIWIVFKGLEFLQ